jgi:tetratricopeptide (TPR) repeat protein
VLSAVAQAHIDSKNGDAAYAIEQLKTAEKRDKKNAALQVQMGDAYLKMNNGSQAYESYKAAIELNDKMAAAYHRIGDIFLSQKSADLYLDYYTKSIQADPDYAPSLYKLYAHYFYYDPAKALQYYNRYLAVSDPHLQNEYDLADLFFLNQDYPKAIEKANALVALQKEEVKPRLYKLLAYSYAGKADTATAIGYMKEYFRQEADSNFMGKDFASMGDFLLSVSDGDSAAIDSAAQYYAKATQIEKDSSVLYSHYKKLADLASKTKNFREQAKWLEKYYTGNEGATNLDLFNWALAHYRGAEYGIADSVFGLYVAKYPDQSFGYYWQARAVVAQDEETAQGLAVPNYQKLIEVLNQHPEDPNYKTWMVEALGYLAAYEVNTEKDFDEAIGYFEKVLEVDPENESAKKYIAILEKNTDTK